MVKFITFKDTYLLSTSTVASKKEYQGPLGKYFDFIYEDLMADRSTYEQGEAKMIEKAISIALKKSFLKENEIDLILGGDLSSQLVSSTTAVKEFDIPYVGIYAACATSIASLILGSMIISSKILNNVLTYASSNYGVAERQFRYPNEYGVNKRITSTVTASGVGVGIVSLIPSKIEIVSGSIGQIIDVDSLDINKMGEIMAYAAYDTIQGHLFKEDTTLKDYDLILTGDLGKNGSEILKDLFKKEGEDLHNYLDSGTLIYDENQDYCYDGGSGCACISLTMYSYVIKKILRGELKNVLLVGTGCLHSKISPLQGTPILSIAHAIHLRGNI